MSHGLPSSRDAPTLACHGGGDPRRGLGAPRRRRRVRGGSPRWTRQRTAPVAGRREDAGTGQQEVPGPDDLPRQPRPLVLRRGPGARRSCGPVARARPEDVRNLDRRARLQRMVWHGVDGSAERDRERGRDGRGPRGSLRRQVSLRGRYDGRADACGPRDARPREGVRHVGSCRIPAVLRRLARQLPHGGSARSPGTHGPLGVERRHLRAQAAAQQRLGRRPAHRGRLPAGGRRERLVLRDPSEPRVRHGRARDGRAGDRGHDPGLRRPTSLRPRGPGGLDRELGGLPRRGGVLRQLRGARAGLGHLAICSRAARATRRSSVTGPATIPMPRS